MTTMMMMMIFLIIIIIILIIIKKNNEKGNDKDTRIIQVVISKIHVATLLCLK